MGLFDWLRRLFAGESDESPADVAERLERVADCFRNAGNEGDARAADAAADEARQCGTAAEARRIERGFYESRGLRPDGRPVKPVVGRGVQGGPEYVRYGTTVRAGGSKGWRYNNPGYLRCGDRATYYGAIGCDGEYAIFPDPRTGRDAMIHHFRAEYPDRPLGEALREQLPPAEAAAAEEQVRQAGIDLGTRLSEIADEQLHAVGEQCLAATDSTAGDVFDRDDPAAAWASEPGSELITDTESTDSAGQPSDDS